MRKWKKGNYRLSLSEVDFFAGLRAGARLGGEVLRRRIYQRSRHRVRSEPFASMARQVMCEVAKKILTGIVFEVCREGRSWLEMWELLVR